MIRWGLAVILSAVAVTALAASLTNGDLTRLSGPAPTVARAQVNGLIGYGQSNEIGTHAQPALSTTQPYSNITFIGGVKASHCPNGYSGVNCPQAAPSPGTGGGTSATVPLVEDNLQSNCYPDGTCPDLSTSLAGETPGTAALNKLVSMTQTAGGAAPANNIWFYSAAGRGGETIALLQFGATVFGQLQDGVQDQYRRTTDLGKSYALRFMDFMEGEADALANTAYSDYLTSLSTGIATPLNNLAKSVHQRISLLPAYTLVMQTPYSITPAANDCQVARATIDGPATNSLIKFVSPIYPLYFWGGFGDGLHLNNVGQRLRAQYLGLALYNLDQLGTDPSYLKPLTVSYAAGTYTWAMSVPNLPLVIDTTTLGGATVQHGLRVVDTLGDIALSNIRVSGSNILADGAAPTGAWVGRIGCDTLGSGITITNGAGTDFRDSSTATWTEPSNGLTYPLYNWAPAQQLTGTP